MNERSFESIRKVCDGILIGVTRKIKKYFFDGNGYAIVAKIDSVLVSSAGQLDQ